MALEITNLRFLDQLRGGRPPGAEVSMLKIKGTEIQQALSELMMQAAGPVRPGVPPGRQHGLRPLHRAPRRALLQHAQDVDLRRLQRDPAEHHRQGDARALRAEERDELRSHRRSSSFSRTASSASSPTTTRSTRAAKIVASPKGWSEEVWGKLAEMGLMGLPFPAEHDGFGGAAVDVMVVMEAIGEGLIVEPYLPTVGIGGQFVARGGSPAQQKRLLPDDRAGPVPHGLRARRARRALRPGPGGPARAAARATASRSTATSGWCCTGPPPTCWWSPRGPRAPAPIARA